MGRWSRLLAPAFLEWAQFAPRLRWLDVGCGTGNLAASIRERAQPRYVAAFDPAEGFVTYAATNRGAGIDFGVASAQALPVRSEAFDVAVAGLVLNFVPSVPVALAEMTRVVSAGGMVGAYVWDYADGMSMLRKFFDAAIAVDVDAVEHDEGRRFPICQPDALRQAFAAAGMQAIKVAPIAFTARFANFDDYWLPFVGGATFPAAAWLAARPESTREGIRRHLLNSLPIAADGTIELSMRAWAVSGVVQKA
jgi:ubiquinone/menaquinone biosynthesis C-methylase UbiE